MKDILFSAKPVQELNQLVQDKLAPQLFLCCNYNPLSVVGMSDDGKYYPAIENLYRVVSDCSCVIKRLHRFQCKIISNTSTIDKYRNIIDTVNMLRSVVAHNNSVYNGRREAEHLDDYHCWVQRFIGKSEPVQTDDYVALLAELRNISNALYDLIEEYILTAAEHAKKDVIIEEWESYIIDWYCGKNVKRDIFLGVLEDEYLARLPLTTVDHQLPRRVAYWIQNYYTNEVKINNFRKAARDFQSEALNAYIEKLQETINTLITETEQKYNSEAPFCFVDRFFSELGGHLKQTLLKEKCSMLPEILLQKQIQILFDSVSIPVF